MAVMTGNEDDVTESDEMPNWLYRDRLTGKYLFCLDNFPFEGIPSTLGLNDKAIVNAFNWNQFNSATTRMLANYYDDILSKFYHSGISSQLRRSFCSALASNLHLMSKKYRRFRNSSAKGKLDPDLSKTVKGLLTYSVTVFLCVFMTIN